jgi:hypothetical protein
MEEHDFFKEVCSISLYATKAVRFADLVDFNGKTVTSKCNRIHSPAVLRKGSAVLNGRKQLTHFIALV